MFFTKAGRVVAWLAIIFGCLRIALALFVVQSGDPNLVPRYLGSGTTGQAINHGFYVLIFGIVIGVLTDISRSVAKETQNPS
jgi:amino acid permease